MHNRLCGIPPESEMFPGILVLRNWSQIWKVWKFSTHPHLLRMRKNYQTFQKKFQGQPNSWPRPNSLAYSSSQSQETSESCPPRKAVFWCFFGRKKVFPAKRSTFTYSMSYIFWKLLFQLLILAIKNYFLSNLRGVRILLTHCNCIEQKIRHHATCKNKCVYGFLTILKWRKSVHALRSYVSWPDLGKVIIHT